MSAKDLAYDLELAMQALRLYQQAHDEMTDDLVRSKIDLRIIRPKTRQTIMVAMAKRNEILRRVELQTNEQIHSLREKH